MGLVSYIIPFAFVLDPSILLGAGGSIGAKVFAILTAAAGVVALCFGVEGYFRRPLPLLARFFFGLGGLGLILPGRTIKMAGAGLILLSIFGMMFLSPKRVVEGENLG
jgi:TRAP-type uncharacterized transport system fused permease subunit